MTSIYADEVRAGDVVVYHGELHRIVRVDRGEGFAWPIAVDGTGWGFALDHHLVDVLRQAA